MLGEAGTVGGEEGTESVDVFETRSMVGARVGAEGVGVSSWLHV